MYPDRTLHLIGSTLYVGGRFKQVDGLERPLIFAFDVMTETILPWKPTAGASIGSNEHVRDLDSDGTTLYVGGGFDDTFGGAPRRNLMAVTTDTGVVLPWAPEPNGTIDEVLVSGGALTVGGWFSSIAGANRSYLATFDIATQTLDGFTPNLDSGVGGLCRSGSTLYVGGYFSSAEGQPRSALAAYDMTTGSLLPWAPPLSYGDAQVNTMDTNGTGVAIGGSFRFLGGARRCNVGVVDTVGGHAKAWEGNAAGSNSDAVHAVRMLASTTAFGGTFHMAGARFRPGVAELDLLSGEATDWAPFLGHPQNSAWPGKAGEVEVGLEGVYVGGTFGYVNGTSRAVVALIDRETGQLDPVFDAKLGLPVYARSMLLDGDRLYLSGDFETPVPGYEYTVALDSTSGVVMANFTPGTGVLLNALSRPFHSQAIFVCGSFVQIGDPPENRKYVAALDEETGAPLPWSADPSAPVSDIELVKGSLYMVGDFLSVNGQPRRQGCRLDAATGALAPWDPDITGPGSTYVNAVLEIDGRIYLGGRFDSAGSSWRKGLASVDPVTGAPTPWDPGATWEVLRLDASQSFLVAVGSFPRMGNAPRKHVAVFELYVQ